jgi:hypothetical protein
MPDKRIVNVDDIPLADNGNGDAFVAKIGRAALALGPQALVARSP